MAWLGDGWWAPAKGNRRPATELSSVSRCSSGKQRDDSPQPRAGIGWFYFQSTLQLIQPFAHSGQPYAGISNRRVRATQPFLWYAPSVISHFKNHSLGFSAKANVYLRCSRVAMHVN